MFEMPSWFPFNRQKRNPVEQRLALTEQPIGRSWEEIEREFDEDESEEEEVDEDEGTDIERSDIQPEGFEYQIIYREKIREHIKNRMRHLLHAVHDRKVGSIVFLDRSARPLAWMFRSAWKERFPNEAPPDVKFANIGYNKQVLPSLGYEQRLKVGEKILASSKRDEWLSIDDAPEDWKELLENPDPALTNQLRETYSHTFDGNDVLILDEFGYTGGNQMMALGLFHAAFPDANWQAGSFYASGHGADPEDIHALPWFRKEGMAGILELPDGDLKLLSGALNENSLLQLRKSIDTRIQQEIGEVNVFAQREKEMLQNELDFIRQEPKMREVLLSSEWSDYEKEVMHLIVALDRVLKEQSYDSIVDYITQAQAHKYSKASSRFRMIMRVPLSLDSALFSAYFASVPMLLAYHDRESVIGEAVKTHKKLAELKDVKNMRANFLQLRKEMNQLGRELAQAKRDNHS